MNSDTDAAAARLALLAEHFTAHPAAGPATGRRTPAAAPGTPLNLAVVDHIRASVDEIAAHTHTAAPNAGPVPREAAAVYEWCVRHTKHADETVRLRGAVLIYRQQLEHDIRLGDAKTVRKHRCPGCGTLGLHWRASLQRAVCRNRRCRTTDGRASMWSLAHLAHEHVQAQETRRLRAT